MLEQARALVRGSRSADSLQRLQVREENLRVVRRLALGEAAHCRDVERPTKQQTPPGQVPLNGSRGADPSDPPPIGSQPGV